MDKNKRKFRLGMRHRGTLEGAREGFTRRLPHAYAEKARLEGVSVRLIEAEGMIHNFFNVRRAVPSSAADIDRFVAEAKALLAD